MVKKKRLISNSRHMQTFNSTFTTNGKVTLNVLVKQQVRQALIDEIIKALNSVNGYGSIEIYVQDHSVTQITVRNIKKTKHVLAE